MAEEKYYTPNLSEFHQGFEFEKADDFRLLMLDTKTDKDSGSDWQRSWHKMKVWWEHDPEDRVTQTDSSGNTWNMSGATINFFKPFDVQSFIEQGLIRVKYLDSEDIEDLGWNLGHKSFHHLEQRKWYDDRIITGGNGKPEGEPTHFLSYIPESCNLQITVVSVADKEMRGDFPEDEKLNGKYCYNGKCYNKSELRWIMDRLGINTEKDQT